MTHQRFELGALAAVTDDDQIDVPADTTEGLDERLHALDRLEPAHVDEVGPSVRPGAGERREELRCHSRRPEHLDAHLGEPLLVEARREPTRAEDQIELGDAVGQERSRAPELRRSAVGHRAAPARARRADLSTEAEEAVRRAEQPMLVRGVEAESVSHPERSRSTDQRRVVEVHDVEPAKSVAQCAPIEDGLTREVGGGGLHRSRHDAEHLDSVDGLVSGRRFHPS